MSTPAKNKMDMTHGTLWNKILIFALPLAASSILQQLFNSVDTAVVGRFASSQALAAVGSNGSLISLLINLFIGISLGSNVVIAHYIGQGAQKNIQAAIHTAIVVALVSGFFVMILGQFIARPVLLLMGTPEDVIDLAVLYLRIYLLGMPFIMLYDFGSSILRSTGDSKRPLYSLIVAGVINTLLNLVLVIGFKLSVSGVAIATVISNVVSSGIVIYFLAQESEPIKLDLKKLAVSTTELKKILKIGVPAGLQGMMFSLISCGLLSAVFVIGRGFFLGLYSTDANVLVYAKQRICIATTLELLTSIYEISAGAMRGLGHSMTPAVITFMGSCVLRLIWISTACKMVHEFWVLMIIYPISWIITGIAMMIAYGMLKHRIFKKAQV